MEIINLLQSHNNIVNDELKNIIMDNQDILTSINNKLLNDDYNFDVNIDIDIDNYEHELIFIIGNLCIIYKKYNIAIKYYKIAIDKGNINAMNSLGVCYYDIKDYENAVKYYLMAIDKGNINAINNLGLYYDAIKDYDNAIKYYKMAIDKGDSNAMNNLALYYDEIANDYNKAIKYYLIAIDKGNITSIYNLALYYDKIAKDYNNAIKYYLMSVNKGDNIGINNLELLFINNLNLYINTILNNDYKPNNIKLVFIKNNLIINEDYECPICYEDVNNGIKSICDHSYCINCFLKIDLCALCRSNIF
jgi:TPR repeat protein